MQSKRTNFLKHTLRRASSRLLLALLALACPLTGPALAKAKAVGATEPRTAETARNKRIAVDCLDLIFNRKDIAQARTKCFGAVYIQHNPRAPDGPDAILQLFDVFVREHPNMSIQIKRVAADGDLVWVHYHAKNDMDDPGRAVVDILRLANGRFIEHWDVSQPVPAEAANSNTMF